MDPIRICVVDDSAAFRAAAHNWLSTLDNIEIIGEVAAAEAALRLCAAQVPDLVLVDLVLPTMQGLDFIRRVKHIDNSVKIVVTSLHEDEAYRRAAITLGADYFIPKARLPFDLPQLIGTLTRTAT